MACPRSDMTSQTPFQPSGILREPNIDECVLRATGAASSARSTKTISARRKMAARYDEGRTGHGPCGQDEGVSRVRGPGATFPPGRGHGRSEVLRSVPDRDEEGEGMPSVGPRWQRVHRLLPVVRPAHPGPRPSARDEGDPGQPRLRRNDNVRHAPRTRGDLCGTAPPDLPTRREDALHDVRNRGDDSLRPVGEGVPEAANDREVRRPLPWWCRRIPREPHAVKGGGEAGPGTDLGISRDA